MTLKVIKILCSCGNSAETIRVADKYGFYFTGILCISCDKREPAFLKAVNGEIFDGKFSFKNINKIKDGVERRKNLRLEFKEQKQHLKSIR